MHMHAWLHIWIFKCFWSEVAHRVAKSNIRTSAVLIMTIFRAMILWSARLEKMQFL